MKYVLGIETSCDDTAAAVVARDGTVLSSIVNAQHALNEKYGGVFPSEASRAHLQVIVPTVDEALTASGLGWEEIDAIAVTRGPGLVGSLQIGLSASAALAWAKDKRRIAVNHLRGHLRSVGLEGAEVAYPALVLLVSGGHTVLARMESPTEVRFLGGTRDDSIGESFDKVARLLGLGFPGGPAVDRLAATGEPSYALPRPMIGDGLEFSFSGLKSAVRRILEREGDALRPADVAASFVAACSDVLSSKVASALGDAPYRSFLMVGGVAASVPLRAALEETCVRLDVPAVFPRLKWATDNAAMIALAAFDYDDLGVAPDAVVESRLKLESF